MRKVISKKLIIICVCTLALFFVGINSVNTVSADSPTTYYVATTGSDENPGTFEKPFLTIGKAATVVVPGDTVYIRGGTYYEQVTLTTSGSQNKPITWEGYGNETVIINGINRPVKLPCPIYEKPQIYLKSCDWQILRKLTVVNSPSYGISDYQASSNHNIYEYIKTSDNYGIGFRICGDYNQLLDCESSYNFDYAGEQFTDDGNSYNGKNKIIKELNPGEDSDGFSPGGNYNILKRCVSFHNSDDGYDCWESQHILFEDCIAYENGTSDGCRNRDKGNWTDFSGDGNGFKLGEGPEYQAFNTTLRCIAYKNTSAGICTNSGGGNSILNCTAYANDWCDIAWWDNKENTGTKTTTLKNNIAFTKYSTKEWTTEESTNSWNIGLVPARESDFVSLDPTSSDFLKLSANSRFIDKGTDIGYTYYGSHPDLGAYEYQPTESSSYFVYGDVDGDGQVTAVDFALLKKYLLGQIDTFPYEFGEEAADVDGDGQITALDFAMMKSYLLGKINKFKAEDT